MDLKKSNAHCPCGVKITEVCYIENICNGNRTFVGNVCVEKFDGNNKLIAEVVAADKMLQKQLREARKVVCPGCKMLANKPHRKCIKGLEVKLCHQQVAARKLEKQREKGELMRKEIEEFNAIKYELGGYVNAWESKFLMSVPPHDSLRSVKQKTVFRSIIKKYQHNFE